MSLRKLLPILIGVSLLLAPALASTRTERVKALEDKVAALETQLAEMQAKLDKQAADQAKISKLEQRLAQLERQVRQNRARGGQAKDPAKEKAAGAMLTEIRQLASQGKPDEAKAKLALLDKQYAGTNAARAASRLKAELAIVGKPSPKEWKIDKWFQGEKDVALGAGKPTLVVFWEVWCPHCRREVPKMQRIFENFHPKGLQVVGLTKVTKSATDQKVKDFIAQQKVTYPIAKEKGDLSAYFGVRGIPAAALLKDGKVVWRGHPAGLTDKMLQDLL